MKKFTANLIAYIKLIRSVQFNRAADGLAASNEFQKKAETASKQPVDNKPQYKWRVEVNTGGGMRRMNVDAPNQYTAETIAMTRYMQKYFKVRAYQLTFVPNPEVKHNTAAPAKGETKSEIPAGGFMADKK